MKWVKGNRTSARVQQAGHPEHAAYGQRPKHGAENAGDHARNQGHVHQQQEHGGNKSHQRPERKVQHVSQEGRLLPNVFGQPLVGRKGRFWFFGFHGFFLRLGVLLYCIRRSRMTFFVAGPRAFSSRGYTANSRLSLDLDRSGPSPGSRP
jgi:hypothetical protein